MMQNQSSSILKFLQWKKKTDCLPEWRFTTALTIKNVKMAYKAFDKNNKKSTK